MLKNILPDLTSASWWKGIILVAVIALLSQQSAGTAFFTRLGLGPLTLAIIMGILAGNTVFPQLAPHTGKGVDYAKNTLLRAGIILYGFHITFQQIAHVGWAGIAIDTIIVTATFILSVIIGQHVLHMDKETTVLIGTGSAICGAAAVMGAEPVIKAPPHKVAIAVATVVVFGTLGLFLYPLLFPLAGLNEHNFGIYIGSTVHEVAQVVAAGKGVGETAAESAVITKMFRVMLLLPFLLLLSAWWSKGGAGNTHKRKIIVPWFAVLFIAAAAITSTGLLPAGLLSMANQGSTLLLAMAMAALGLRAHFSAVREAGIKPLILAGILFLFLVTGGGVLNYFMLHA